MTMSEHLVENPEFEDEPSEREIRISRLLADFLKQEDEGTAVGRERFLKENEDVAEDLQILLEMADMIQEMAGPVSGDELGLDSTGPPPDQAVFKPPSPVLKGKHDLEGRPDHGEDTPTNQGDSVDFYLPGESIPPV